MTWIKTVPPTADPAVLAALEAQASLYPREYVVGSGDTPAADLPEIVASHTLIPGALWHAFSTFGALMAPALPLTRRQHELIATVVSVTNRCHY